MPPSDEIRDDPGEYRVRHDTLRAFNAILQRDSTDTTYKYALLRALVEIAEQESHHVKDHEEGWVKFPLGLVVERWMYFYYLFVARDLPQRNGENAKKGANGQLAFRCTFKELTDYYERRGGLARFMKDMRTGIPKAIDATFRRLQQQLRETVTDMPMRYLGKSKYQIEYSIVNFMRHSSTALPKRPLTRLDLISCLGFGVLRREYYELFRAIGGFATGTEAIFGQWARFTERVGRLEGIKLSDAAEALFMSTEDPHATKSAVSVYESLIGKEPGLLCVWSRAAIHSRGALAVDHVIPYSIWGDNSCWNLMPATRNINSRKGSSIPAPDLIEHRAELITRYWDSFRDRHRPGFENDFKASLAGLGVNFKGNDWKRQGLDALKEKCAYLIDERGYVAWSSAA